MIVHCELMHDFNYPRHTSSSCGCWGQEDVENYSKQEEGDVSHNAHPEAWVLEELFIVVGEKNITNGHARYTTTNMGHKRDLTKTRTLCENYIQSEFLWYVLFIMLVV